MCRPCLNTRHPVFKTKRASRHCGSACKGRYRIRLRGRRDGPGEMPTIDLTLVINYLPVVECFVKVTP